MILTFHVFCSLFVAINSLIALSTLYVVAARFSSTLKKWEPLFQVILHLCTPIIWYVWIKKNLILPEMLFYSGIALLSAGQLMYLDVRSLLSRGYSARILADLLDVEDGVTIEQLKRNYGDGKGVDGLLEKRLMDLRKLRLVTISMDKLTVVGAGIAMIVGGLRKLWRFREVG